ncbi:hypothetical protein FD729_04690 [Pantoea sp. Nvir]|nr:hypothetical protein [Pantoea sp. Nvir]
MCSSPLSHCLIRVEFHLCHNEEDLYHIIIFNHKITPAN